MTTTSIRHNNIIIVSTVKPSPKYIINQLATKDGDMGVTRLWIVNCILADNTKAMIIIQIINIKCLIAGKKKYTLKYPANIATTTELIMTIISSIYSTIVWVIIVSIIIV
jgi:hypothetical protein